MPEAIADCQFIYSELGDDPDLAELVELFVEEMPGRIQTLSDQLGSKSWEELARTAHQLKGAAGSYGFDQLTPYAQRLELTAREGSQEEEIQHALEELIELCRRVRSGVPT